MTTTAEQPFNLYVSSLRGGDVITFDGHERITLTDVGWDSRAQEHVLHVEGGDPIRVPSISANKVVPTAVLHERPGIDGFRTVYKLGDRVHVYIGGCVKEWRFGIVIGDFSDVYEKLGKDARGYEVATVKGGAAAVGPENMRRDPGPAPQVGEWWETVSGSHRFRITAVRERGLIVGTDCDLRDMVASSEYIRPVRAADIPLAAPVFADLPVTPAPASWGAVLAAHTG